MVTPRHTPNLEYINTIESVCSKLGQQDAEEIRADINRALRSSHPPNLTYLKYKDRHCRELKRDRDRLVLTADKGVAIVIIDRQDYANKSNQLLSQPAFKSMPRNPTNKIKSKLINILKGLKCQTGLYNNIYRAMYPMGCGPPTFYGLP